MSRNGFKISKAITDPNMYVRTKAGISHLKHYASFKTFIKNMQKTPNSSI